eukprot:3839900-Prorocentrum_lima.AAC.1
MLQNERFRAALPRSSCGRSSTGSLWEWCRSNLERGHPLAVSLLDQFPWRGGLSMVCCNTPRMADLCVAILPILTSSRGFLFQEAEHQ